MPRFSNFAKTGTFLSGDKPTFIQVDRRKPDLHETRAQGRQGRDFDSPIPFFTSENKYDSPWPKPEPDSGLAWITSESGEAELISQVRYYV